LSELPFVPYEGPEPYIFVSYAHANKDKVYPIIKQLHEKGYRLWWDEGIRGGDKWWRKIVQHIHSSCYMLLFVTSEAVESEWVEDEVMEAREHKIAIFPIYLQRLTQIHLPIKKYHFIEKWAFPSEDSFTKELCRGLPERTKRSAPKPIPPPPPKPEPKPVPVEKPTAKTEKKPAPPLNGETKPYWLDFSFDDSEATRSTLDADMPTSKGEVYFANPTRTFKPVEPEPKPASLMDRKSKKRRR